MISHRNLRNCAVAVVVATLSAVGSAQAQTVRDEFTGPDFAVENWFPCVRDENVLSIVPVPGQGFNAARLAVTPRPDLALVGLSVGHNGCRRESGADYSRGVYDERAELWEADGRLLKFGTEVWYRFDMYIDSTLPADRGSRLVVGQWKTEGGHSPFIAQRFVNRHFVITVEQDNDDPASDRDDDECRIVIAYDEGFPNSQRGEFGNAIFQALPDRPGTQEGLRAGSIAHDRLDTVNGIWSRVGPCAQDLQITRFNNLPNAIGNWTTMMYHIRATADGRGLLEVWANGNPVVALRGRFGFRDGGDGAQYFKFGPYRAHVNYPTYALFAKFARGRSRADVE
jgi:hypothetical protein